MSANRVFRQVAAQVRLEAALDDRPAPNRASIRAMLKHQAPRYLRRAIFGTWRLQAPADG